MNDSGFDTAAWFAALEADLESGERQVPPQTRTRQGWLLGIADDGELADLGIESLVDLGAASLADEGPADRLAPGPVLATLIQQVTAQGLQELRDIELLGAMGAAKRLMSWASWTLTVAQARYADRQTKFDPKTKTMAIDEFAREEVATKLNITGRAAEDDMYRAQAASRRLPQCMALLRDGAIDPLGMRIIADVTCNLSDALAAKADKLIAQDAADRTPGSLRGLCTRTVMKVDAEALEKNRKESAKTRRAEVFQEYSGNAAVSLREIASADALAIKQNLSRWAQIMRKAGMAGNLDNLRADAATALLLERHPLSGASYLPEPGVDANADGSPWGDLIPAEQDPREAAEDPEAGAYNPWRFRDEPEEGCEGTSGAGAPAALITLLVPVGLLDGTSDTPAEVPGFGFMTGQPARDLIAAASRNQRTRWCITVVGADKNAAAHGCARGPHTWAPWAAERPGNARDGPAAARDGPDSSVSAHLAVFLDELDVRLRSITKGVCDHSHQEAGYRISRRLRHLLLARTARCTFPGCGNPGGDCDADHTVPWPEGPSCECNLGPPCRRHHRTKQASGWSLEQPEPGLMVWRTPSGRTLVTRPTEYDL